MGYVDHLIIFSLIWIILALSLNIIIGFTGLLNLGHAAFFGIGAYTSALLTMADVPFIIALVAGALVAALAGFLIGLPCLPLRGDYLAIATLGFGEIIRAVLKNWSSLTRGPLGIPGIPKPSIFGWTVANNTQMLFVALFFALLTVFIVYRIKYSPFGRVLKAIREDELAAQSLGKDVVHYKLTALAVGAGLAGVAGSLYAHYITFIDPTTFNLNQTILIVSMVVLGGIGSIRGSILGAILLTLIPEPLRFLSLPSNVVAALRQIIYSAILILLMLIRPEGLLGEHKFNTRWSNRLRKLVGLKPFKDE